MTRHKSLLLLFRQDMGCLDEQRQHGRTMRDKTGQMGPQRLICMRGVTSVQTRLGRHWNEGEMSRNMDEKGQQNNSDSSSTFMFIEKSNVGQCCHLCYIFKSDNTQVVRTATETSNTSYLTSMDWTPSDSSSKQLFSRGPSMMTGVSAGVEVSSSKATGASARVSDAAKHHGVKKVSEEFRFHCLQSLLLLCFSGKWESA